MGRNKTYKSLMTLDELSEYLEDLKSEIEVKNE